MHVYAVIKHKSEENFINLTYNVMVNSVCWEAIEAVFVLYIAYAMIVAKKGW